MLGPAKPRRLDQPIGVTLDDLVPQSNFYRHVEAKLDLSFVRAWARDLYGERRPSIDPVVFIKLQLAMFFEGIRSKRQLIETARLNLAHRWYQGYALDEALSDHSSPTRIRQRLGIDIFKRVVDLSPEAGLFCGRDSGPGGFPPQGVYFLNPPPQLDRCRTGVNQSLGPAATRRSRRMPLRVDCDAFVLIAAMNPCPCGYSGDPRRACTCAPGAIGRYRSGGQVGCSRNLSTLRCGLLLVAE